MNNFTKRFLFFLFSLIFINSFFSFAQENQINQKSQITTSGHFKIGSALTLNLEDKTQSAPSPVNFVIGGGAKINFNKLISLEPSLDFWSMYYLFYDGRALPAEVEHRTSSVLCFLLDIPVGFNFELGKEKNCVLSAGLGIAFLARVGFLANGVKPGDKGSSENGTAKNDNDAINKYFWNNARFLMPEFFIAFDYKISQKFTAGIVGKFYLPISSIAEKQNIDCSIFTLSARFGF